MRRTTADIFQSPKIYQLPLAFSKNVYIHQRYHLKAAAPEGIILSGR
jgi:hypothetical protein